MDIKIFGSDCCNCQKTYDNVMEAVKSLNLDCTVEKVSDLVQIAQYAIVSTPAIAIDGNVVVQGSILSVEQVKDLLLKFTKKSCGCSCGCN